MKSIEIPKEAAAIISALETDGFKAYAVGGCVRDRLLGAVPHDWDITTSARPDEIKRACRAWKTADTGLRYGTVSVIGSDGVYEVTTFRSESSYDDFRHPSEIVFSGSLKEDLSRRDFTVNAIAASGSGEIIDPLGGAEDILRKTLRCVGKPAERFSEDPLRILRGVRFAMQLGFGIDGETSAAMNALAPLLSHIAAERIKTELEKAICAEHFTAEVFSEYEAVISDSIGVRFTDLSPQLAEKCRGSHAAVCWAALMLPLGSGAAEVCRRLKFSNNLRRTVCFLTENCNDYHAADRHTVRRLIGSFGADNMLMLGKLRRLALGEAETERTALSVLAGHECCSLRDMAVNGSDLIKLGICGGREIGSILGYLLDSVLRDEVPNEKSALLNFARNMISE